MSYIKILVLSALTAFISLECSAQLPNIKVPKNLPNISGTGGSLTDSEIINGLKEALTQGAMKASSTLNKTDGYNRDPKVRIPFPEDARTVATKLRQIGYGKQVDEFETRLNRSAEHAAKEASAIFVNSIKQMNFDDAKNILKGSDTAATAYLRKSTYSSLFNAFTPHIKSALDSTMATQLWFNLTTTYNKLPTTRTKVQTDLISYTTHKGLKGLFILVSEEELKIRKDPMARASELLKKVFGSN